MATLAEELEAERKKKAEGLTPQAPVMPPELAARGELERGSFAAMVPGMENVTLANAPQFSPDGVTYPELPWSEEAVDKPKRGRQAKPFGSTPTAPVFDGIAGNGLTTGRGGARRGADTTLRASQAPVSQQAPQPTQGITQPAQSPSGATQGQESAPQGTFSTARPSIDPSITAPISAENFANPPVPEGTPAPVVIQGANGTGYQQAPEGMVKAMSPDGKMVFAAPEQAATMNQAYAAENTQNTQAQKDFLASDAMREFSNRQIKAVQNSTYSQASAAREQGLADRPDFGTAVSDREKRGTGEMSMADAVDLAGGNRKEARAMIIRQRQGLDPMTGKPTEAKDNRTPDQIRAQELQNQRTEQIITDGNKPDATPFQKKRGEWEERAKAMLEDGMSQEEVDARRKAFNSGDKFDKWAFDNPEGSQGDKSEPEASQAAPTPTDESVMMIDTNGKTRKVPSKDKDAALKAGYTLK